MLDCCVNKNFLDGARNFFFHRPYNILLDSLAVVTANTSVHAICRNIERVRGPQNSSVISIAEVQVLLDSTLI